MVAVLIVIGVLFGGLVGVTLFMSPGPATPFKTLAQLNRLTVGNVLDGEPCTIGGVVHYGDDSLVSPVTGRRCAYYSARIMKADVHATGGWKELVCEHEAVDFFVVDGEHKARVDVADMVVLVGDVVERDAYELREMATAGAFCERHADLLSGRADETKISEMILEQDQAVGVSGFATAEADPSGTATHYRAPPKRLVIQATNEQTLLIVDDPQAGLPVSD